MKLEETLGYILSEYIFFLYSANFEIFGIHNLPLVVGGKIV